MFCIQIVFAGVTGPLMSDGLIAAAVVLSFCPFVAVVGLLSLLIVHVYLRLYLGKTTQEYLDDMARKRGDAELQAEAKRLEAKWSKISESADDVRKEWLAERERVKIKFEENRRKRELAEMSTISERPPVAEDTPGSKEASPGAPLLQSNRSENELGLV